MSDILTREEFEVEYDGNTVLMVHDAALRACIQQAVLDVEKLPHAESCAVKITPIELRCRNCETTPSAPWNTLCRNAVRDHDWYNANAKACDCGHAATIAGLKKGLGEK